MLNSFSNRRVFLKNCGLGCLALGAARLVPVPLAMAAGQSKAFAETRFLMGTVVSISLYADSPDQSREAFDSAFAEMERLIAVFDHHNTGTALSDLNSRGRLADAPAELLAVLGQAGQMAKLTENLFNPNVKPVLDFMERHANPAGFAAVESAEFQEVLALAAPGGLSVRARSVRLERSGMALTLDGLAKGYIVDAAAASLDRLGLRSFLINAGGDIFARGPKPDGAAWTVAIEDPKRGNHFPALVRMTNGGLATSGGYERYYDATKRRHHLVNQFTGQSPVLGSVSATAPTAAQADCLATALSLLPTANALALTKNLPGHACLILTPEGRKFKMNWS